MNNETARQVEATKPAEATSAPEGAVPMPAAAAQVGITHSMTLSDEEANGLNLKASTAFQPRSPINNPNFFAGRLDKIQTIVDSISEPALHIVIFGERGVGKSSIANIIAPLINIMDKDLLEASRKQRIVVKVNTNSEDGFGDLWRRAFDDVYFVENIPTMGFSSQPNTKQVSLRERLDIGERPSIDDVRKVLRLLPQSVFIFDEFDRGSIELKRSFTDLIKALSDYSIDSTVIVVGVSDTVDELVQGHASIGRSLVQVQLLRMKERELSEIIDRGSNALGMRFEANAVAHIVKISQGLPHYTHLISLYACRQAITGRSRKVSIDDVNKSFVKAVEHAIQTCRDKCMRATHSSRQETLNAEVLLACAAASMTENDELGYFHPRSLVPKISIILKRTNVKIATFQKHINEFCQEARGPILERDGVKRAYKYRFTDPLLPPYIFMNAISSGLVTSDQMAQLYSN